MRPLLLCSSCDTATTPARDAQGIPEAVAGSKLTCSRCGEKMLLATYGIVDSDPTVGDLGRYGLYRARGTWWR